MASATMIVAGNRLKLSSSTSTFYSVPRILHPKSSLRLRAQASSIAETFSALKRQEKVAFIPYITAGDPDLSTTAKALKMLSRCGADLIELGLPFSDPVLDGPASHKRALANKTSPKAVISMLKEVVPQISCPIVVFSYYNMILSYKSEWFLAALEDAGLIVPDLPFEESATLREEALKKNIDMVLLTTPTTPRKKMEAIADASGGFLYLVSSAGVTGARPTVNSQVQYLLRDIKRASEKPVAVGFGVSKPQHVRQVRDSNALLGWMISSRPSLTLMAWILQICSWGADGVIVGSAIVRLLGEAEFAEEGLRQMKSFVECLTAALPSRNPALEKSTTPNFFREDEFWGRRAAPQPKSTVLHWSAALPCRSGLLLCRPALVFRSADLVFRSTDLVFRSGLPLCRPSLQLCRPALSLSSAALQKPASASSLRLSAQVISTVS
ncbi:hypothetical protein ZIOFF_059136 [Zingiber officinale]|uniref:tryptophan synthase n=1 Tax=Zingiber officinale TaxID=94328 RepID=A0A8J5KB57_ZINOF|nr:hypothetical protein ZIOFF_059136 [Zingiber officinale]